MSPEKHPEMVILIQDSTLEDFQMKCNKLLSLDYELNSCRVIPNLATNGGTTATAVFLLREDNRDSKGRDTVFQRKMQAARKQRLSATNA